MKITLSLAIAFAAILILVGCGNGVLETPDVDYVVADSGATLRLSWTEIADADGYYIYADGAVIDTVTTITYDATTPAAVYGVSAYAGEDKSGIDEVDCTPVATSNINVYGNSDPAANRHSGIGFIANGNCVTIDLGEPSNHYAIDFYFDDSIFNYLTIVSPNDHQPTPYNSDYNTTAESGIDYDELNIAADLGNYDTPRELSENLVLSFWIDPDHNDWDATDDHFGKMRIENISGMTAPYSAIITAAYQLIPGLQWVVTN